MFWKYAMILVHVEPNDGEETCSLVELYSDNKEGAFESFCQTRLLSPEDLEKAAGDINRDGINRWFYENGVFSLEASPNQAWNWERYLPLDKALIESGDIETYEDEIELYKVYGGD